MSPLGFLRRVRYGGVRDVALVQTGSATLIAPVLGRLRETFPGCTVHVVLRPGARVDRAALEGSFVEAAQSGGRRDLVRRLRRRTFDVAVMQLGDEPLGELAPVAVALRARSLVAFNQNLDHFPISVHRLSTIARHFGGSVSGGGVGAVLRLALRGCARLAAALATTAFLIAAAARIHLRAAVLRRSA